MNNDEGMYTVSEVAAQLRVNEQTVRNRIADGSLHAINAGTALRPRWRISADALARFEERPSA